MKRTPLAILVFAILAATASCSGKKGEAPSHEAAAGRVQPVPAALPTDSEARAANAAAGPSEMLPAEADWRDAFKFVRDAIRTEPSRYNLKTAQGIEWGRSANPLEKAVFLAGILREKGMTVEIARGALDEAAAKELLRSIFPPAKKVPDLKAAAVSQPAESRELVAAVTRHFWVRMQDGDRWIDLDPSFPAAEPGRAFAEVEETLAPTGDALAARVSITVDHHDGGSGEPESVLAWTGSLGEVAGQPLALVLSAEFTKAGADEEPEGGGAGGLFGGLSGSASGKKKDADTPKTFCKAALMVGGENLAVGRIDAGKSPISRITLSLKVECLMEVVSGSERVLFEAAGKTSDPPLFQRHAILITGDRIPASAWQAELNAVADKEALAAIKTQVEEVKQDLKAERITRQTLEKGAGIEQKAGAGLGHLLNMIFASTSDDEMAREGASLEVAYWYAVPRILITSFLGHQKTSETLFDLRQDRVEAIALPGQARTMKQSFLYGRGVVESALEGKLLEIFSGQPALTTAALMRAAAQNKVPIRLFSALEKAELRKLGPPDDVVGRIASALDAGRVVMIPEKPVTWEGRERWAWWDVDPQTMETVGVLDTGLHQAMVQRTILETEGPLDSKMGMVIGAMTGAIDTYWLLSAMVLKYGELNKQALLEAKAYMKDIQAVMCPEFEEKIEFSITLKFEIEDCYEYEYEFVKVDAGVGVSMGWCENFAKGFACASTSILNYYLSQFED